MPRSTLDELLDSKHQPRPRAAALARGDLDLLTQMVADREHPKRERAISLLVEFDPTAAVDLLARMVMNGDEPMGARVLAAAALGRVSSDRAERALLSVVRETRDVTLLARAAHSLCRIAAPQSRETLQRLARSEVESVSRLGRFGLALVAHRAGERFEVPEIDRDRGLDPRDSQPIVLTTPPPELLKDVLPALAREDYGCRLDPASTYAMECGDYNLLCVNADMRRGESAALPSQRPLVLAIVALRSREDGSFSTSRVILGGPRGRSEFYLVGYRTDGTIVHAGRGKVANARIDFDYTSVVGDRRPIEFDGVLSADTLVLQRALSGRRRPHRGTPSPLSWSPFLPRKEESNEE